MIIDMNVAIYYGIFFALSAFLTGIYILNWHKHYDVHITLVYVLVPVINLSYFLVAQSTQLESALVGIKVSYAGGCFLELIIMLLVFSLCGIQINRWIKFFFFLLSCSVFALALTIGHAPLFYKGAKLNEVNGVLILEKDYGRFHILFTLLVLLFLALSFGAIIYSYFRKNQVSRKILLLLLLPDLVAILTFFLLRRMFRDIELIPIAFVFAQIMYLILTSRLTLYDVVDTAVDSLVQNGATGLIAFDFKYRYLGSNETAKEMLPGLRGLTVDRSMNRDPATRDLILPWLRSFEKDEESSTAHFEQGEKVFLAVISWLYNNEKKRGFQLILTDDTKDQHYIRLLNHFNTELQSEVEEKSAHIEEMHDQLILSMATMVESRDNSTGGHIRRTSEGVRILLAQMDDNACTESFRKNLIKAAPMHDLGKIAVDDVILRKPGRFTPEEFEKMKAHAAEGFRIVHEILKGTDNVEFRHIAENVAHYHHERWDGSGYPSGLKGEEIPREARIMAIADVYDALVSKRVYKDKMSFAKADSIMMEGMGTQFAPEMKGVYLRAKPFLEEYYSSLEE